MAAARTPVVPGSSGRLTSKAPCSGAAVAFGVMRDRLDAVEAQQAVDVLRAACGEGVVQLLARHQMVVPTVDPMVNQIDAAPAQRESILRRAVGRHPSLRCFRSH